MEEYFSFFKEMSEELVAREIRDMGSKDCLSGKDISVGNNIIDHQKWLWIEGFKEEESRQEVFREQMNDKVIYYNKITQLEESVLDYQKKIAAIKSEFKKVEKDNEDYRLLVKDFKEFITGVMLMVKRIDIFSNNISFFRKNTKKELNEIRKEFLEYVVLVSEKLENIH